MFPTIALGQYSENTLQGIGSDSINLSYIRAFNPDSIIMLRGRLHVSSLMPSGGLVTNFWKTYATSITDSNSSTEKYLSDSIEIPAGGLIADMSLRLHTVFLMGHSNQQANCDLRLKWGNNTLATVNFYPANVSNNTSPARIDWYVHIIDSTSGRVSWMMNAYDGNVWKTVGSASMANFTLTSGTFASNTEYLKFSSQWSAASVLNKTRITFIYGEYSDRP